MDKVFGKCVKQLIKNLSSFTHAQSVLISFLPLNLSIYSDVFLCIVDFFAQVCLFLVINGLLQITPVFFKT